ncbi:MAG TPA: ATP-binding protein [Candidatus Competibacteraceae bacterium]|nr:ATP-binding protein [Candidatus Competibacteraceae bacterium]
MQDVPRSEQEIDVALLDSLGALIVLMDRQGRIVHINRACERLTGYSRGQVQGCNPLGLLIPEGEGADFEQALARLQAGEIPLVHETVWLLRDGRRRIIQWTSTVLPASEDTLACFISTGFDLTEQRVAERALRESEEKARQQELQLLQANKMTTLGILVAGVVHEINNPNNLMLLNASLLAEAWRDVQRLLDAHWRAEGDFLLGGLPYSEMRETVPLLLADMYDGAQRIRRIVDSLRDFSRPSSAPTEETYRPNDCVLRVQTLLRHLIAQRTSRFELDLAADLPPLRGDARKVEQVLINLMVNALEALPEPSRWVRVATRWDAAAGEVELSVQDAGVGIPPEHLERVFEPFFTTKQAQGGTGLGLAIAHGLVQGEGGRIELESILGQGTLVRVRLPVAVRAANGADLS